MIAIVAVDKNWGIGKDGDQLIYIPEDLKRFKNFTTGNTIVLGSDAHSPHDTFRPETIAQAHDFARNLGLNPTEDIRIRNPFLR